MIFKLLPASVLAQLHDSMLHAAAFVEGSQR
jgi:hypothetical protein